MSEPAESVQLQQLQDYRFEIRFADGLPPLQADEPAPLGAGEGPSPVQLLASAVGNCLSASLLFALRKYKQAPEPIGCRVAADQRAAWPATGDRSARVAALHRIARTVEAAA